MIRIVRKVLKDTYPAILSAPLSANFSEHRKQCNFKTSMNIWIISNFNIPFNDSTLKAEKMVSLLTKNIKKKFIKYKILSYLKFLLYLRFRKAGKLRCGSAREPHWAICHNRMTPRKTKEFLKSPCFFRS